MRSDKIRHLVRSLQELFDDMPPVTKVEVHSLGDQTALNAACKVPKYLEVQFARLVNNYACKIRHYSGCAQT